MRELEVISDLAGRAGTYASLAFSIDTVSPEVGALMQQVQERSAILQTTLLFFDLEWNEVDDERAEELLAAEEISLLPPLPAHRAPLPPAPADRAGGADSHRGVGDR